MDVHDKKTRSFNMSRIRSVNTKPELLVRKFLFSKGFRFRIHDKKLPGKPDIVLPRFRTVVLIHGCFWHGHKGCKYFKIPKTRTKWWIDKIDKNRSNDYKNKAWLGQEHWKVIAIFECQLKSKRDKTLTKLLNHLK